MDLLTKEEIQKFGFTYEPDATKCKTRKLRTYVPKPEMMDEDWKAEVAKEIPYQYVHEVKETTNPYEGNPNFLADPKVLVVGHTLLLQEISKMENNMSNAYKPVSWCGRPDVIQNFCVTFSHNFNHQYSRIKNNFVIKGASPTKETALKIAEMLFPDYTDIIIESIENDTMTLTPSEYYFLQGKLKAEFHERMDKAAERRKEQPDIAKMWDEHPQEKEYNEYLLMLIKKMEARMDQFPVYHT